MRSTLVRRAASVTSQPLSAAAAQLLPPIPLYRRLLRAHRILPKEMRLLGDDYVKAEFRRTQTSDNPLHIIGFLSQWKLYLDELESNNKDSTHYRGKKLQPELFEKLSAEQLGQLHELMQATKEVWGPDSDSDGSDPDPNPNSRGQNSR